MSFTYTHALAELLRGNIDLVNDDIRVLLAMEATTMDTEEDVATISAFSTPDFYDGTNNARKALANEAVSEDAATDRGEFVADPVTWTALGAGTTPVEGALVYKHITDDTDHIPLFWITTGGIDGFQGNGSDFTIEWNAEGIAQATVGA